MTATDKGPLATRICGICGDNHATCSVYAQNIPPDSLYVGGGRAVRPTHSPTGLTLAT